MEFYLAFFRHFLGEELDHLGINDLQELENQLDTSLKRVRSTQVFKKFVFNCENIVVNAF